MEALQVDEAKKTESHMTSAAAFVEGGIQDACDDSCSICLEGFCDSDPSTVTSCKHEFHLQCVLEWCQRSSNCPMCWQNISLKDPGSQELLDAVERERSIRFPPSWNARIFHHPTLGDFELPHFPAGVNDAELEDRIIQHIAAAAAVGRRHRVSRREGSRGRFSGPTHSQFLVPSTPPNGSSTGSGEENEANPVTEINGNQISASSSGSLVMPLTGQSSLPTQDRAGPSEFHSISDNWKSRFSSISRYKESISKSTKELKEKLFSRSPTMAEVRKEVNAGIATVSRMMERLETRESNNNNRTNNNSSVVTDRRSNNTDILNDDMTLNGNNNPASLAAASSDSS